MPQSTIDDVVKNADNVFYNKNNGNLYFLKDGDVVVTDKLGNGITSYGKSGKEAIAVTEGALTGGKHTDVVFKIE